MHEAIRRLVLSALLLLASTAGSFAAISTSAMEPTERSPQIHSTPSGVNAPVLPHIQLAQRRPGGSGGSGGGRRGGGGVGVGIGIGIGAIILQESINQGRRSSSEPRIVCRNGRIRGSRCVCPRGRTLRRKGRKVYSCDRRVADPSPGVVCRRGRVRSGKCVCRRGFTRTRIKRRTYACNRRVADPSPGITCRRGRVKAGRCICPSGRERVRLSKRRYTCNRIVADPVRPDRPPRSVVPPRPKRDTASPSGVTPPRPTRVATPPRLPTPPPPPARYPATAHIPVVAPDATVPEFVPDEVLVTVPADAPPTLAADIARTHGMRIIDQRSIGLTNERMLRLRTTPGQNVPAAARRVTADPRVSAAQPNYLYQSPQPDPNAASKLPPNSTLKPAPSPSGNQANAPAPSNPPNASGPPAAQPNLPATPGPGQPGLPQQPGTLPGRSPTDTAQAPAPSPASPPGLQYALTKVNAFAAHGIANGRGVIVAVVDSGVDGTHPDLAGAIFRHFDALGQEQLGPDTHGTAIAGIIGGRGLVRGVAPDVKLLDVQAFRAASKNGPRLATSYVLATGVDWAMTNNARVLNLSFEGPRDPALLRVVRSAAKRGAIMVAAAGNGGASAKPAYPAAYQDVIAVTATDPSDKLYDKANRGGYIAIAAPGVDIFAPMPGKSHGMHSGTSFAAAHVSGIIALLLQRVPDLTAEEVLDVLLYGARDLGPPGPDSTFGAGEADAIAALKRLDTTVAGRR